MSLQQKHVGLIRPAVYWIQTDRQTSFVVPLSSSFPLTVLFFTYFSVARVAVVHLNLRAGSTFPVPVCAASPRLWVNKADTR